LKKELKIIYFIIVAADLVFGSLQFKDPLLVCKNIIPLFLIFSFIQSKNYKINQDGILFLVTLFLLLVGLNFSFFFHTTSFYLPIITILYFFEIQIQMYLVLKKLKKIRTKETKGFTIFFLIISFALLFIVIFFPAFSFPIQILFFIRLFQFSTFLAIVFGNKKINYQISLSLLLIILSNVSLLVDLVIFNFNFEYAIIMLLFYSSKFFFLNGYLWLEKQVSRPILNY
jgi:hypothetical protein